ncbi:hypothetical protein ACX6XY_29075 [Streptomyces sp. O3]
MSAPRDGGGASAGPAPYAPEDKAARPARGRRPCDARRDRPSWLIDAAVALVFLIADAVIVVGAGILLAMIGMGREGYSDSEAAGSPDIPLLVWLAVWGVPAFAVLMVVVYARLRMPITTVVQTLFGLACTVLAFAWTRMFLS